MELHRAAASSPLAPLGPPPAALIGAAPMTLGVGAVLFLEFKRGMRGVLATSQYTYRGHLERFIRAVGASATMDEASGMVEPFLLNLARRELANSYRAKAHGVLRDFYRWGCERGHARLNPLRDSRGPIVHDPDRLFLSVAEVRQLLDSVRVAPTIHARRDHALFATLYGTWARVGAVVKSRPEDFDLRSCTARLYEKGGKDRVIPFDPELRPVLEDWLALRPRASPMMFPSQGYHSDVYGVLDRDRVARALREVYAPRAGLGAGVTPHTLRRSAADHARLRGVKIEVIQRILGHKYITTTMRYLGLPSPDELKGAWEKREEEA